MPLSTFLPYKVIRGHFLFSYFKDLPGKRFTFLRDPIERVLSAERYSKTGRNTNMSVTHLFPPGPPINVLQNNQCKYLSSLNIYDPNISDEEHLKSAKYNLEHHFFFVGITEDLDKGIPILCSLLGFDIPFEVPKLNTTTTPEEGYPEELIQEIKERNLADIELYKFAKKLYERTYKRQSAVNTVTPRSRISRDCAADRCRRLFSWHSSKQKAGKRQRQG